MTEDGLHAYLRDLGRRRPLTHQDEHDLAVQLRDLERAFWTGLLAHAEPAVREVWAQKMRGHTRPRAALTAWLGGGAAPANLVDLFRLHDGMRRLPPQALATARTVCPTEPLRAAEDQHRRVMRLRSRFVEGNLRLAVKLAQFWTGAAPLLDLIQEANLGLCRAVSTFDPDSGFKFSTYAGWWIKNTVVRSLDTNERVVRLPAWLSEAQKKYGQTARRLRQQGQEVTPQKVAKVLHWSEERLQTVLDSLEIQQTVTSLDARDDPEDRDLHERLSQHSGEQPDPEDVIDERRRYAELMALVETIPKPMVREILYKRFGLGGQREQVLVELGDEYDLSKERIRQLEREGLLYLQRHQGELSHLMEGVA